MSILKDIDTTTIDYYGDKFDKIFVDFKIFIFLVLILVLVFVIRFFVLINTQTFFDASHHVHRSCGTVIQSDRQ